LLRTGKLLSSAFNKKFPFSSSFCRRIATGFSLPLYGHAGPAFFVLTAATAPAGVSVAHVSLLFFFVSFSLTKRPSEKKNWLSVGKQTPPDALGVKWKHPCLC
jgi:hypothetical protein